MKTPEWLMVLIKLGIPGGIAVFLVWRLAGGIDSIEDHRRMSEAQHTQTLTHVAANQDIMGQVLRNGDRVLWVLQQMCVQNARTTEAQMRCLGPTR